MKLTRYDLDNFYNEVDNADNVIKDDDGKVLSFDYMKYYGCSKHSGKRIKVSLKSAAEVKKMAYKYLNESAFFNLLCDNIDNVENIKTHFEKIYKFTLHEKKYSTDKLDKKKLFDFLPYKEFLRVARNRFYGKDNLLRNGYFSGLIGTNDDNILKWQSAPQDYKLYDIDFNAAYPYCFKLPLPCGRFYTPDEWRKVKHEFNSFTNFYHIKIKSLENHFNIYIPPAPYFEFYDFDFLLTKNTSNMIVSKERLRLIQRVYGNEAIEIKKIYFCPTKIYLNLMRFSGELYEKIQVAKETKNKELEKDLKVALNSLVGNFGKRDETKTIDKLELVDNGFFKDSIIFKYTEPEYKEARNYLPLAMMINDITARRLFNLLTNENALRLCYNTDGGIVALRNGSKLTTSKSIGQLKAERIYSPQFYYCSMLYARPLVYCSVRDKCYNTKSIHMKSNGYFYYSERVNLNTRSGFKSFDNEHIIKVEPYAPFNFRQSEILIRLHNNKLYKRLRKGTADEFERAFLQEVAERLEQLCSPYDSDLNDIRHAAAEPQIIYAENFIKNS